MYIIDLIKEYYSKVKAYLVALEDKFDTYLGLKPTKSSDDEVKVDVEVK